jgi:hypothetical protein
MTDSKKQPADGDKSQASMTEDGDRLDYQPGDVNEGHGTKALQEASERMLLRKDRA